MSSPRPWLVYSLLRVGLFAVCFAVLALAGVNPILAAVIAAVFGLCVTYIFFRGQRDQVAQSFYQWRTATKHDRVGDAEVEVLDRSDIAGERSGIAGDRSDVAGERHPFSEAASADDVPRSNGRSASSEGERDR